MSGGFKNFFSFGDVIDLFHLLRLKGLLFFIRGLELSYGGRSASKWNKYVCSNSDFWIIPDIKEQWNKLCTGDKNTEYENYVVNKYLNTQTNLHLLSVGCGNSSHEQTFSQHACFSNVTGIDISESQLAKARQCAVEDNCTKVTYKKCNFEKDTITKESYDVILFHSSIHHFRNIEQLIKEKTLPILKPGGLVILFDYTGPNRLQWRKEQLEKCNQLLTALPPHKKMWYNSQSSKRKIYPAGLFRMWVSDPSEAYDSEAILPALHKHFTILEEKKLGCNILHPLLKSISQHFIDGSTETQKLLQQLIKEDEAFAVKHGSDFTFGVYRKKQ
jgi:ubiquinone/menaquinone biosynthesis C-methylase UbiE